MADNQLSLFDLLEDPRQRQSVTEPRMWTLRQLCDRYYQFKRDDGCSDVFLNSIKRYLGYFTTWLKRYGVNPDREKLSDLDAAVLSDYRQMLADKTHIGIVTANLYIAHVRMLLNWAEDIYGLPHPPMGVIRKFRKNKSAKKGHGRVQDHSAIGWEELEHLFAVANVTDTALLLLGLNCGFGNTDIGTLKLSDLDLEKATVCHPRQKTGTQRRFILWPETVEILKAYLKRHRGTPANEQTAQLVFVNRRGNPMCFDY